MYICTTPRLGIQYYIKFNNSNHNHVLFALHNMMHLRVFFFLITSLEFPSLSVYELQFDYSQYNETKRVTIVTTAVRISLNDKSSLFRIG